MLAKKLKPLDLSADPLVLALPRGGVPIATRVAVVLDAEVDLLLVRKLGHPAQPELAMGAIASTGGRVINPDTSRGVHEDELSRIEADERRELQRREQVFRGDRPAPDVSGRDVVVVDDGVATGSTIQAATSAVRAGEPRRVVIAVPLAPPSAIHQLKEIADVVVCPQTPEPFVSIGQWYENFTQLSDADVQRALHDAWTSHASGSS